MVAGCVGCLIDWVVCCVCAAASFAACYALANMMTCCLPACHCASLCQCVQKPQGCGILRATFRSRFSSLLPSSSLCCCVLCFCLRCAPDCLFWLVLSRSVCVSSWPLPCLVAASCHHCLLTVLRLRGLAQFPVRAALASFCPACVFLLFCFPAVF